MPTAAAPRGKEITFLIKDESTFGTPPSGNWTKTFIYSHSLEEKRPFETDGLLGVTRANNRDTTEPAPGLPTLNGNIVVPLDLSHIGLWLKGTFGAATDSGSTPDYTHVWTSGLEILPHRSAEVGGLVSSFFLQYTGLIVNTFAFDASRRAGYDRATVGIMGKKENKLSSTGGGTPASPWARDPLTAALPVFKINTVIAADIMSISGTYDNKVKAQEFLGSDYVSGHDLDDEATFEGTMRVRFRDATLYDMAAAGPPGTAFAGEFLWSKSSVRSLSIAAPVMRLERRGIPVPGPMGIEVDYGFRAQQPSDGSAPMLTVTLKNAVASY